MSRMFFQSLDSCLRVSTPLIFGALAGLCSECVGVTNIALEGMMLVGALGAVFFAFLGHSPWWGELGGMLSGGMLGLFYGLFAIEFKANQIVAGMAINLFASGLTSFLTKAIYDSSTATPSLPFELRFQMAPVFLAFICMGILWFILRYTPLGIWMRFAGENPEALDSAGVGVRKVRWIGVALSGCLAGMGGASLSIFLSSSFSRQMTAGRGFMALAALIFGKWKPLPAGLACLFFGCSDVLQIRLQGAVLLDRYRIPTELIQIIPYVLTVLILAGMVGNSRPPKALGQPFIRS